MMHYPAKSARRVFAAMIACVTLFVALATHAQPHRWTLTDGSTIAGDRQSFVDDVLTLKLDDGTTRQIPFDTLSDADKKHILLLEDDSRPLATPPWQTGYRARYALRVVGDLMQSDSKTVIAKIPTGGWLKKDLSDLIVTNGKGELIPIAVLSHNPLGDTIIQFRRHGMDRWYWVYLYNPQAPDKDKELAARLAQYEKAAEQANLRKMALQKSSAEKAATLRDITATIAGHEQTLKGAVDELAAWDKERPGRLANQQTTTAAVPPLDATQKQAAAAHAPFQKEADDKTAAARELTRSLQAAQTDLANAQAAHAAAVAAQTAAQQAIVTAQTAAQAAATASAAAAAESAQAEAAAKAAEAEAAAAKVAADATPAESKANADNIAADKARVAATLRGQAAVKATQAQRLAEAVTAAQQAITAAQADAAQKTAAVPPLAQAITAAQQVVQQRTAPSEAAEKVASDARLAAQPTTQVLAAANQALAAAVAAKNAADGAVNEMNARVAAATTVKNDNEASLAKLRPQLPPIQKAADDSAAATVAAVADAQAKDKAYYDLAHDIEPRLYREGLTVEFREWAGDKLNGWPEVVDGLQQSDNVLGNAIVGEVLHDMNPFRRNDPRNFAASYRGYLQVDAPGFYSFFANGDDTSFLFINKYRVYSRSGTNAPISGRIPLYSVGADLQLEAGAHPFELHHVIGNTPDARGLQMLLWLPETANAWTWIKRENIRQALLAIPQGIEAADGKPLATFEFGMDDTVSADGLTLYLGHFGAQGQLVGAPAQLQWTFADGNTRTGGVIDHIFFKEGDQIVSLKSHPSLPAFRRRVNIWMPPTPTSPLSLAKVVSILNDSDITKYSNATLADLFHFLQICEQPTRWPVMEKLCNHMLKQTGLDPQLREELYAQLMLANAQQGRGIASMKVLDTAMPEFDNLRALKAHLQIQTANVYRDELRNFAEADRLYGRVIEENARLRHPVVRRAAVEWGDMFMQAGDNTRAGESFRLARTLGTVGAGIGGDGDPVKRGALLRVAEQQLKQGNIRQTRRLLTRIEQEFPEQKLEGLYRYLRGEAQRYAGNYDLAVQDYEVLLNLAQWAGYRANAMFGIADSYYRMGDYPRAMEWFQSLEESFPAFIEAQQLGAYKTNLQGRLTAASEGDTTVKTPLFTAAHDDFEPTTARTDNDAAAPVRVLPLNGIDGTHTVYLDARNGVTAQLPLVEMTNIPPQGSLWVEFWYRDHLALTPPGAHRYFDVYALDQSNNAVDRGVFYQRRTFGDWQKVVFPLKLPPTRDGRLKIVVRDQGGTLEIDGLRVMHVSDAQNTALRNFLEGASPQ
jgi:tetratricopeptide (TPR) repeat protein